MSTSGGRVHVIDAIRGLAVFGILVANVQNWSGYKFVPYEVIEALPLYEWDRLFNALHYWLVDGKFYAIFSLLFGAGFGLQFMRKQDQMDTFLPVYRRRLAFLFLFGVLHALFWSGDILTLYALLAFLLVAMRNIPANRLLPVSLGLLAFFAVPQTAMMLWGNPAPPPPAVAHVNYVDLSAEQLRMAFAEGSWAEVFRTNLHNLYWRWLNYIPNGRFSRVLGLFVLGFFLARSGFFTDGIYRLRNLGAFWIGGLSLTAIARVTETGMSRWAESGSEVVLKVILVAGQVLLALAYMALLAHVYRFRWGEWLLHPLTLIGRMAFTSYLGQSVIGVFLFYGVGFGLWGTMGLAQLWAVAVAAYAVQVLFCSFWLTSFRQGPIEWLWGCLTQRTWRSNRL
jgi:uncharacterized protein